MFHQVLHNIQLHLELTKSDLELSHANQKSMSQQGTKKELWQRLDVNVIYEWLYQ